MWCHFPSAKDCGTQRGARAPKPWRGISRINLIKFFLRFKVCQDETSGPGFYSAPPEPESPPVPGGAAAPVTTSTTTTEQHVSFQRTQQTSKPIDKQHMKAETTQTQTVSSDYDQKPGRRAEINRNDDSPLPAGRWRKTPLIRNSMCLRLLLLLLRVKQMLQWRPLLFVNIAPFIKFSSLEIFLITSVHSSCLHFKNSLLRLRYIWIH